MYSESAPVPFILHDCQNCTRQRIVHVLKVIVNAMGNSKAHKRLYYKFQSTVLSKLDLLHEVRVLYSMHV